MGFFAGPISGNQSIEDADRRYREGTPGESLGNTLNTGDINQDGYADLLLSAYHDSTFATRGGVVYLLHGSNQGLPALEAAAARFHGQQEYGYGGVSVVVLDDFSADESPDVAIGEYGYQPDLESDEGGAVRIFLDNPSGVFFLQEADLTITGNGGEE